MGYPTITVEPYQISSDNSYDSMTKVTHPLQIIPSLHDKINNYFTSATSDNAIFQVKNTTAGTCFLHYYIYLRAPHLRIQSPTSTTDPCTCHGSHAPAYLHETYLPGCLLSRLTPHQSIHVSKRWPPMRG